MAEIHSKNIELSGCSLHYLEAGTGEKTVLLLHGMKFNAETWRELGTITFLADLGLRVIAVDMPGFGESPASDVAPQKVLEKFFSALALQSVTLIGPSMGGRITLEYGIAAGETLDAMVVVGAVGVEENKDRLAEIKVPVLVVWGEEDAISPLTASDILLDQLADARRVIFKGAPHPCYLDQPDNWHNTLKDFL